MSSSYIWRAFLLACRQGIFDGAELTLYRAFMPTYGDTAASAVIMFVGRVAEIDASRKLCTFSINSHLELLNLQMPRNLYQRTCVNTLFDAACTLTQSAFGVSGTAQSGSTQNAALTSLNIGDRILFARADCLYQRRECESITHRQLAHP